MLPNPDFQEHVASYYSATRNDTTTYPALSGNTKVDTCVIGGGLAGVGTALPLAKAGKSVALIEAARIGYGASGRNGGQVIYGWAAEMSAIAHDIGIQAAQSLWNWSVEAVELIDAQVHQYGINCDWQRGYAHAAVRPRHLKELQEWQQEARAIYGYDGYQLWDQAQLQQALSSDRYVGALFDHDSGHIHPLNYLLGLSRAAQAAGATLYEHTPMHDILPHQGGYRVFTPQGYIDAQNVVVAVNAFTQSLKPALLRPLQAKILPVGTYIIATEPLGEQAQALIRNNMAVCDTRFVLDYYRLSGDGRLLFGGKVNYAGREPTQEQLIAGMRRDMLKVFPQLTEAKIDFAWGGDVDITMNRAPHFGRLAPNLYFMQGFSGHGVAATGLGGLVTAEAILGDDSRLRVFELLHHRNFPGGPYLRLPSQWLGVGYYRLKDLLP
ncbi:FAD-binding oxidoreductase [Snodgrassella sp. CFCC 13594]|uniref:NAD(P)/FAD-dependent oxidoreductase n=1 Tax=Snodgrassella sp. CFCC 13594 TaxID=1775559 RepID=UPI0008354E64|nr:FAD-binding oxidoreductase [Snodgrassella sp. CFCC 13594]